MDLIKLKQDFDRKQEMMLKKTKSYIFIYDGDDSKNEENLKLFNYKLCGLPQLHEMKYIYVTINRVKLHSKKPLKNKHITIKCGEMNGGLYVGDKSDMIVFIDKIQSENFIDYIPNQHTKFCISSYQLYFTIELNGAIFQDFDYFSIEFTIHYVKNKPNEIMTGDRVGDPC